MITLEESRVFQTPCECCGLTTREVTGDLFQDAQWSAFYSVVYTANHPEKHALFSLGIGDWSDTARPEQRWVFGAFWSVAHQAFMLRGMSQHRAFAAHGEATKLDRLDILHTPFADEAFAMLDAVLLRDSRLKDLHS